MGLKHIWETAEKGFTPERFMQASLTFEDVLRSVGEVCAAAADATDRETMLTFARNGTDELREWFQNFYPSFDEHPANRQRLCLYLKRLVSGELAHGQHVSKNSADTAIENGTDAKTLVAQRLGMERF